MNDIVQRAKQAREKLATALAILQSPEAGSLIDTVAEPVARAMGADLAVAGVSVVSGLALGIDGASETDGLEVTSAALGDRYPAGLLVVQDGRNIAPEEPQNFKFVSWQDVAQALRLE